MNDFSFKRVFTASRNNFKINKALPTVIFIITAILLFLSTTLPITDAERYYQYEFNHSTYTVVIENSWKNILGLSGIQSIVGAICAVGAAVLSGIMLTSRFREKKSCDFWSSVPTTRVELLFSDLFTGFVYFAVSVIPTWYISLITAHALTTEPPIPLGEVLLTQTPVLLFILLFYLANLAFSLLASTIAGSVVSSLVVYATITVYPAFITYFASFVSSDIFATPLEDIMAHNWSIQAYSSPLLRLFFSSVFPIGFGSVVLYIAFTVAAVLLLIFLVSHRKNELAQNAVVFPVLRYPIQYLWTLFFTLFAAWFLYAITSTTIWFVFGALIGVVVSFMLFNLIFEQAFTGIFKNLRHLFITVALFIVIVVVFIADAFGMYKNPVPDFDDAQSFSLHYSESNYDEYEYLNVYADELDEGDREIIAELWKNLGSLPEQYGDTYVNISVSMMCEGDPSPWHTHCHTRAIDQRTAEIINYLKSKYPSSGSEGYDSPAEAVVGSPDVTVEITEGEKSSIGIIGGADGPTAIFVSP